MTGFGGGLSLVMFGLAGTDAATTKSCCGLSVCGADASHHMVLCGLGCSEGLAAVYQHRPDATTPKREKAGQKPGLSKIRSLVSD